MRRERSRTTSWRVPSEDVGAVRAEADRVLKDDLVVDRRPRLVAVVLQAEAAELAGAVVGHDAVAHRRVAHVVERRAGEPRARRMRVDLVVTNADAPARHELIDGLR